MRYFLVIKTNSFANNEREGLSTILGFRVFQSRMETASGEGRRLGFLAWGFRSSIYEK
jgi:hypothetical protein